MSAFIQWKGTDVCLDFTCTCGRHAHFDGESAYVLRCECGQLWEMPETVQAVAVETTTKPVQQL